MANRTVSGAIHVHGTDPQNLIEKITREKIYGSLYWKSECYGLDEKTLVNKALELTHIGGTYGANMAPTPFLCLLLKLCQLQPSHEVLLELLSHREYKYLVALLAFYIRLVGSPRLIYTQLEPLLADYRKLRVRETPGYTLTHLDEFVDALLQEDRVYGVILPRIPKRPILEDREGLPKYQSPLQDELEAFLAQRTLPEEQVGSSSPRSLPPPSSIPMPTVHEAPRKKTGALKFKQSQIDKTQEGPDTTSSHTVKSTTATTELDEIAQANALRAKLGLKPLRP